MATANTITKASGAKDAAELVKSLFTKTNRIYYVASEINASAISKGIEYSLEFDVIDETFKVNEGDPSTTEVKTTYQSNITSKVSQGDSDCSMQIASIDPAVLGLFKTKGGATRQVSFGGKTYSGYGYSSDIKKVNGSLVCISDDENALAIITNVEMFGSIVTDDGDNPLYINVSFTFKDNSDGESFLFLQNNNA